MNRSAWGLAAAGCCAASLVGVLAGFAAGPLDPPSGAVDGQGNPVATEPSLSDLEAKIDALAAGGSETDGPWEVASFYATSSGSQLVAQEFVLGRVWVHRINVRRGTATLFDGPGSVDSSGRALAGESVVSARGRFFSSNSGRGQDTTVSISIDVIAEDGIYLAYSYVDRESVIQVYYKTLEPTE